MNLKNKKFEANNSLILNFITLNDFKDEAIN